MQGITQGSWGASARQVQRLRSVGALLVLCAALTACRHKQQVVQLPVVTPSAPISLEKAPEPASPVLLPTVPLQPAPVAEVAVKAKKPKKRPAHKNAVVGVAPGAKGAGPAGAGAAPTQVASAGPVPEASVIGALTSGGDDGTGKRQRAMDLIGVVQKRLAGLKPELVQKQKEQVDRARYFERDAETALKAGDTEGAMTLATKAKVLLDDLEQ